MLTSDGIVAARDPHFFPEQGVAPHRPSTLLLWEADDPVHTEEVTASFEAKLADLFEHRSQYRSTMRIDDPSSEEQVQAFRRRMRDRAIEHGRDAGVTYGERFKRMADL